MTSSRVETEKYAAIDAESELDALGSSDIVRAGFKRRRPEEAGAPDE